MSFALDALKVEHDFMSKSSGGLTYVSDQVTYPMDLPSVPDDAYEKSRQAVWLSKSSDWGGEEWIAFELHGNFRPFEQLIIGDPDSRTMPVMANVYFTFARESGMSSKSEVNISFKAMDKPYGANPEDPRIRFVCEGRYDPSLSGDVRFYAVLEVDQNANVNVLELNKTSGDAKLADNSPNGFTVGFDRSMF